jgi:hypothetical protein
VRRVIIIVDIGPLVFTAPQADGILVIADPRLLACACKYVRLAESFPFGAIVFRADCTVDRYAHSITMMPGIAARRLSVQITARATRA